MPEQTIEQIGSALRKRTRVQKQVPFRERVGATIRETVEYSGISKTTLFDLIKSGEIESRLVRGRRIVQVRSILKLLGEVDIAA